MIGRRAVVALIVGLAGAAGMCGPYRPDPAVVERTEQVLRRYDGADLIAVLEDYEARLRAREERDPAVRLALARVFERLYEEREVLRQRLVQGEQSALGQYVAHHPGGSELLAEAGWLYASVVTGRVPPEMRPWALRGLANVFCRKEQDVTACVSEPLAQESGFTWGLVRYLLLRCEARLRAEVMRLEPDGEAARNELRRALRRLHERARLLMGEPQTGPTFRELFRRVAEEVAAAAEAPDPLAAWPAARDPGFALLAVLRHIETGMTHKATATELRAAQADPVGIFHSYERALEHLIFVVEVMCARHEHEGAPPAFSRDHVLETLRVVLPVAQEMIWRR